MGLLGGIIKGVGKIAGKVAKGVLSKATHGLSDVVLSRLKRTGQAKAVANPGKLTTAQQAALVNKIGLTVPRTISTVSVLDDAVEGGSYGSSPSTVKRKRAAGKPRLTDSYSSQLSRVERQEKAFLKTAAGKKYLKQRKALDAKEEREVNSSRSKKAKKVKRASTGRTVPSGGLDLKAISALWQSQGKPGSWIEFIKANPIRKA